MATEANEELTYDEICLRIQKEMRFAQSNLFRENQPKDQLRLLLKAITGFNHGALAGVERDVIGIFTDDVYALSLSIINLDMTARLKKYIKDEGISWMYELVQKTEKELLQRKNFGRKTLKETRKSLAQFGLDVGMELSNVVLQRVKEITEDPNQRTRFQLM